MDSSRFSHRRSQATLKFTHPDGTPAAGKAVKVEQSRHEFLFGTGAFDAVELVGGNADGTALTPERKDFLQDRLEKIMALNNFVTLPFYLGRYEPEEGKPDESRTLAAARWLKERGMITKGHPLCWHTVCASWLMDYSNDEILRKVKARIERDVSRFAGAIDMWDVINEVVIMPIFDKYDNAITRVCKEIGRVSMIREVFASAKGANPGATLLLNDFNTSINYEILIDGCLQAGIPIDVIGIQSHQHQGYWGLDKLNEVLERFSHFGIPVHFTENTIISGDLMPAHIGDLNDWKVPEWPTTPEGEERQARQVTEMYEALFAHPRVEAITTWDPNDGKWLGAPSGLIRKDNSIKPVYEALMERIKGAWWTKAEVVTDANGVATFDGIRGDYTATLADECGTFTLKREGGTINVALKA